MPEVIQWHEPQVFAAGDTLKFQRNFRNYLPSNGWSIHYALIKNLPAGIEKVEDFTSQPDATNNFHTVNIQDFAADQDAGVYVLEGDLVCAPTGENPNDKFRIYLGELELDPDLIEGIAQAPVQTFNDQMIPILQAKIKRLEGYDLTETDVQRTRFIVEERAKAWDRYKFCLEFQNWEHKQELQRNSGINRSQIVPVNAGGW